MWVSKTRPHKCRYGNYISVYADIWKLGYTIYSLISNRLAGPQTAIKVKQTSRLIDKLLLSGHTESGDGQDQIAYSSW